MERKWEKPNPTASREVLELTAGVWAAAYVAGDVPNVATVQHVRGVGQGDQVALQLEEIWLVDQLKNKEQNSISGVCSGNNLSFFS